MDTMVEHDPGLSAIHMSTVMCPSETESLSVRYTLSEYMIANIYTSVEWRKVFPSKTEIKSDKHPTDVYLNTHRAWRVCLLYHMVKQLLSDAERWHILKMTKK